MPQNEFNGFNDFIKIFNDYIGSFNSETSNKSDDSNSQESDEECNNCRFGNSNANATKSQREACSDIPGGFQDIPPQLFLVIGELLGNVMAGNLPFNIQNVVGNWLQLVGQAIEVFNAQQQYFQGGPGRYYNPIYRNAANPFCPDTTDESSKNTPDHINKRKRKTSNGTQNNTILLRRIESLENEISILKEEIEKLK